MDPQCFPKATLKEISNSFWCTTKMPHNKTLSLPLQPKHWTWWTTTSFHLPQSTERSICAGSQGLPRSQPSAELCWVPDKVSVTTTEHLLGEPKSPAWAEELWLLTANKALEMKSRSLWKNVPLQVLCEDLWGIWSPEDDGVILIFQDLYCVRSDLGNLLKALGRLEEAKVGVG